MDTENKNVAANEEGKNPKPVNPKPAGPPGGEGGRAIPSPAELRESAIRERMRAGNMTRENAELVMEHQAAADAKRKKRK